MLKKLFQFLLILISAFIGAMISISVLLWFYEDELGDKIIHELQQNSPAEITVEDQDFSLWKSLPLVSLDLQKIVVKDQKSNILLKADVLGLRLSLLNIWDNELKIENILIQNGQLNLTADRKGKYNYDFLFNNSDSKTESYFRKFNIEYARLKNFLVSMKNYQDQWAFEYNVKTAKVNIMASGEDLDLDGRISGTLNHFKQKDKNILIKVPSEFDFDASSKNNQWVFASESLSFGGEDFVVAGKYLNNAKNQLNIDIDQKGGKLDRINDLFKHLYPEDVHIAPEGKYQAQIKYSQNNSIAEFEMTGNLSNASLKNKKGKSVFHSMSGNYVLSKPKNIAWDNLSITLSDLKCSNENFNFNSDIKMEGIKKTRYKVSGSGTIALSPLSEIMSSSNFAFEKGVMSTNDIKLDFTQGESDWIIHQADGKLSFEHVKFDYNEQIFDIPKSHWSLNKELIYSDTAELFINKNPFRCSLSLPDLKDNLRQRSVQFIAHLNAEKLNYDLLNKVLASISEDDKSDSEPWRLHGELTGSVDRFQYQKNEFKNVTADLNIDTKRGILDFDIQSLAYEGALNAKGKYYMSSAPKLHLNLETEKVKIKQLLKNFDNFDQEVVMDKNIEGKMDSKNVIRLFWDEKGEYLEDRLEMYSDIRITDGELKGLTMLYDLSSFIKLRDLMAIKFSTLHNYLEVSNQTVFIPQMFIQSSAMNMTVAGRHGFDSNIRYGFKFNAGQILLNKLKKHDSRRKPLPAKKEGMFNMYFNMEGTVQDYEVKNSKKLVKSYFEESQVHKYVIYEELKRAYPNITNPEYEPTEWLDVEDILPSSSEKKEEYLEPIMSRDDNGDDDFIEGF